MSRLPTARIASPGSGRDCTAAQTSSAGRRLRRSRSRRRCVHGVQHALVEAVVVRDVAARAQQAAHRPAERRLQARRRPGRRWPSRRPRRSTSSAVEQAVRRRSGARSLRRGPSARWRRRVSASLVAVGAQAFVALDADQAHRRARVQARAPASTASSCVRQPVRPPATPISSITSNGTLPGGAADQASISASCASESTRNTTRRPGVRAQQRLDAGQVVVARPPGWRSACGARRRPRRPRAA